MWICAGSRANTSSTARSIEQHCTIGASSPFLELRFDRACREFAANDSPATQDRVFSRCKKAARKRLFQRRSVLFQPGHFLDGALKVFSRTVGASPLRWHGVEAMSRHCRQARDAFLALLLVRGSGNTRNHGAHMIGPLFPGRGITDFRRIQKAGAMAGVAMFGNHVIRCLGTTATTHGSRHFHALALFALDTHLAHRLEALGDVVIDGRSLSADCPQGDYGCWYGQHFHNWIHAYTLNGG